MMGQLGFSFLSVVLPCCLPVASLALIPPPHRRLSVYHYKQQQGLEVNQDLETFSPPSLFIAPCNEIKCGTRLVME